MKAIHVAGEVACVQALGLWLVWKIDQIAGLARKLFDRWFGPRAKLNRRYRSSALALGDRLRSNR